MAMGVMAGQGARQGYSKMNDGYNEQPGINWGRVGAYAGGAALGYGVLRAGAMKMKSLGPNAKGLWGQAGRITGISSEWNTFKQLGGTLTGAQAQRAKIAGLQRANMKAIRAKQATKVPLAQREGRAAIGLKPNEAKLRAQMYAEKKAAMKDLAKSMVPNDMSKVTPRQKAIMEAAAEKAQAAKYGRMAEETAWGQFHSGVAGARGYFGAMDFAGAKGLTRFGVGATRAGLALGAIGLGMKALSWLNPFSDR